MTHKLTFRLIKNEMYRGKTLMIYEAIQNLQRVFLCGYINTKLKNIHKLCINGGNYKELKGCYENLSWKQTPTMYFGFNTANAIDNISSRQNIDYVMVECKKLADKIIEVETDKYKTNKYLSQDFNLTEEDLK